MAAGVKVAVMGSWALNAISLDGEKLGNERSAAIN